MFTISVRVDEKRSTTSQYENATYGVLLEAQNLELHSRDDILTKTRELFALAKAAVNQQFHGGDAVAHVENGSSTHSDGSGNGNRRDQPPWNSGSNGNGQSERRRSYGRPDPEPTPKQKQLLRRIARDRQLGPETIRQICERLVGKPVEAMDRRDMSRLIEGLLEGEAA